MLLKTLHSKKYGVSCITFTHDPNSVLYASKNQVRESTRSTSGAECVCVCVAARAVVLSFP